MASKNFSVSTSGSKVTGTLTDKLPCNPVTLGTQGLQAIGPRVTFNFITDPWSSDNTYSYYDVVKNGGNTYIARKYVPEDIDISNTDYWVLWAEPNAQYQELYDIVIAYDDRIKNIENGFTNLSEELKIEISTAIDGIEVEFEEFKNNIEVALSNKLSQFLTVNNMKLDTTLKVGDLAQTSGFYNVNDNGKALYAIYSNNDYTANNMDIIELQNDLVAKIIIKDNKISYSMLGAILTEEIDNSDIVQRVHEIANEYDYTVVEYSGTLLCNFTVDVYTNCEFNCNFIINNDTPTYIYRIKNKEAYDTYKYMTLTTEQEKFTETDLYGKSFELQVKNNEATTSDVWYLGPRGSLGDYWHRQPIALTDYGHLACAHIFANRTGNFLVSNIQDVNTPAKHFIGGHIIYKKTTPTAMNGFCYVTRNNTTIKDITLTVSNINDIEGNSATYYTPIVGFSKVMGCKAENCHCNNIGTETGYTTCYIFTCSDSIQAKFENCSGGNAWGAVATHYINSVEFENCRLNRIDNHYGIFEKFVIHNCTVYDLAAINIGYGDGIVDISDTFINRRSTGEYITYRNEFSGINFNGLLSVKNVYFNGSYPESTYISGRAAIRVRKNEPAYNADNFPSTQSSVIIDSIKSPKYYDEYFCLVYGFAGNSTDTDICYCNISNCTFTTPIYIYMNGAYYWTKINNCYMINAPIEGSFNGCITDCYTSDSITGNYLVVENNQRLGDVLARGGLRLSGNGTLAGTNYTGTWVDVSNNRFSRNSTFTITGDGMFNNNYYQYDGGTTLNVIGGTLKINNNNHSITINHESG